MATLAANTTIGGNTPWTNGNDGAGSGLDADLLDGQHASAFTTTSHTHNGTDAPKIPESSLNITDVTTGDVSTSAHGFCPKAPNDTSKFLRGDGTWAVVPQYVTYGYSETDTTTYSQSNTTPVLKKTITLTLPSAGVFGLYVLVSIKSTSTSGTAYVRVDVDDVAYKTFSTTSTSYGIQKDHILVSLTSGSHTVKFYVYSSASVYVSYCNTIIVQAAVI